MLVFWDGGPYNKKMINETKVGLAYEKYDELSIEAKALYNMLYDYCTYSNDPQYKTLHSFRTKISKLQGRDRELLIEYFNHDPAIRWNGIPNEPYRYYQDPY